MRRELNFRLALTIVLLFASTVAVQVWRDRNQPVSTPVKRVLYISSGQALSKMALSYDALLADVYWMRVVQYYGGTRRSATQKSYDLLNPLLDLTTTLDPYFFVAYRFGAVFLSEPYPGGPGRADQAIRLLEKGIKALPSRWEFYLDAGFIYYWTLGDDKNAAQWFLRGSRLPNAPEWLAPMAAHAQSHGGDREMARFMFDQMLRSEHEYIRSNAHFRLRQLAALDDLDVLNDRLRQFQQMTGRFPETWDALIARGLLRRRPDDPGGYPYQLNPLRREAQLAPESPLGPLPTQFTRVRP